jgi:2-phospho-L-lactate guanylyltransferase
MALWVIVPVKSIHNGKSRLAGVLSSGDRERLNIAMLTNILHTLKDMEEITGALIISHDESIQELAETFGFDFLLEQKPYSLNRAIKKACGKCGEMGASAVLILPADLPLINKKSLQSILDKNADPPVVVITPDRRKEGTNSLLINPVNGFNFQFGENSFFLHQNTASMMEYRVEIVDDPGMELDLDIPEDWELYQELIHDNLSLNGG